MTGAESLDTVDTTALPRTNGELVFDEPWESRAFGLAAALADQGLFSWRDFQTGLIAEVAADESEPGEYRYYDRWVGALESLLFQRGVVSPDDVDDRVDILCRRPAGHDHRDDGHDHAHDHDHDHALHDH